MSKINDRFRFHLVLVLVISSIFFSAAFAVVTGPDRPANISLFPGDNKVYITWNNVPDTTVTEYIIYREEATKYGYFPEGASPIDTVSSADTTYIDETVSNGTNYVYWVTAYDSVNTLESNPTPYDTETWYGAYILPRSRMDSFGYTWTSNRDLDDGSAPAYSWQDISSTGTAVPMNGDYDNTGFYPIGFEFPYYNFAFDSFRVSTNGLISFSSAITSDYSWDEFPTNTVSSGGGGLIQAKNNSYEDGNIIAPFWTYFYLFGDQIYYQNFGSYTIIQFDHLNTSGPAKSSGSDNSFQVILYDDGSFDLVYDTMQPVDDFSGELQIGWQNYATNDGLTIVYQNGEIQPVPLEIEYDHLVIHASYDFSVVDTDVPDLFFGEENYDGRGKAKLQKTGPVGTEHKIYRMPTSGYFIKIVQKMIGWPWDVTIDRTQDKLYWIDGDNNEISSSNLDGSDTETVIDTLMYPGSIAIDRVNKQLYVSDENGIYRSDLDGSNQTLIVSTDSIVFADYLAFDAQNRYLYWYDGEYSSVFRVNVDGGPLEEIYNDYNVWDIALDPGENKLYILLDVEGSEVLVGDLDGSNLETLCYPNSYVESMALDAYNQKLYFVGELFSGGYGVSVYDINGDIETPIIGQMDYSGTIDIDLPTAPINLNSYAKVGYNQLKWQTNGEDNVSEYNVYRDVTPNPTTLLTTVSYTASDSTGYKDYDIVHNQKYFYRLVAVDNKGFYSGYSTPDSAVAIGPPAIVLSDESVDYGSMPKNTTAYDTVTIYNQGDTDLEVMSVDFAHGSQFTFSSPPSLPVAIAPGYSMPLYLQFTPAIGSYTDSLLIISDDYIPETDSLKIISLTGSGFNQAPVMDMALTDLVLNEDFITYTGDSLLNHFSDPDGDSLTFTFTMKTGALFTISDNDTVYTLTSINNMYGSDSVFIEVDDGFAGTLSSGFMVTIHPVNDPPVLTGVPDVTFPEEGSAQLKMNRYISDVDNDTTEINFSAQVVDKYPLEKVGEELMITVDSLTNIITFSGGDDSTGIYIVQITAEDDSGAGVLDTIDVTVTAVNDAPVVSVPLSPLVVPEDTGMVFVTVLSKHFSDVDNDSLTYQINYHGSKLTPEIIGSDSLFISTIANQNGSDTLIVTAADADLASVSDTLFIDILPVNDAPGTFVLLSPVNMDTIKQETFNDVKFSWSPSVDIDNDPLVYTLRIANESFDSTFTNITDTTINLDLESFLERDTIYVWSVFVSDGTELVAAADTFAFYTPIITGIADIPLGIPVAFKLHPNYPNPFNPSTTIRYDLPVAGKVELTIFNVLGKVVRKLVDAYQPAGYQKAVWDGHDQYGQQVSTGVYFYMVKTQGYSSVKKMILIK